MRVQSQRIAVRVAIIADPNIPVPPIRYGGSERIIASLCRGLLAAGHQVRLVAGPGSRNYGELIIHRGHKASFLSRSYRKLLFQPLSLLAAQDADVVHSFGRSDYLWWLLASQVPLVVSFMNPITPWDLRFFSARQDRLLLVSASDNHRKGVPQTDQWHTVYPSIDVDRVSPRRKPAGNYLAFLGRLTANKGAKEAIEVAQRTGLPLRIAGNVSQEAGGPEYFDREVRPHLNDQIQWVGEIVDSQKSDFLGNARALLFPIQWEEPFGIALAESFAAGTPVIATRRGATTEQITHGSTGFLCDTVEEMVEATRHIDQLDRVACRRVCEERFSQPVMTARYLELYRRIAKSPT